MALIKNQPYAQAKKMWQKDPAQRMSYCEPRYQSEYRFKKLEPPAK